MKTSSQQGVILAILAYVMWGLAPIYFKQIQSIPSLEILAHRVIWSSLLLAVIIIVKQQWANLKPVLSDKKTLLILLFSSCLLGFNWWMFIWSINNNHMLDASLGYYINPLLNVALGMLVFGERLSRFQYYAVILAMTGVVIQVVTFGSFPYIAFSLAISFSLYGMIRKKIAIDSVSGLLVESLVLLTPAVIYWLFVADSHAVNLLNNTWQLNLLLVAAGLVTTLPLLCFVGAARRLNYSTLGFFQYIGPSIMFLFAVLVYGEKVGTDRWLTFGFIWAALALYTLASIRNMKRQK